MTDRPAFNHLVRNDVVSFSTRIGPIIFVMVATVFTWGLIDSMRRSILHPWLMSQIPVKDTKIHLNGESIDLGDWYASIIVWAFVMLVLLVTWLTYKAIKSHRPYT